MTLEVGELKGEYHASFNYVGCSRRRRAGRSQLLPSPRGALFKRLPNNFGTNLIWRKLAMKKLLLSATFVAFATTTAFAQTTEFYVVRDTSTKKCTIVDKKPTTTTTTIVDNGTFKTRTEAETGMKSMKVCTEN
jgi:hypothetical protein